MKTLLLLRHAKSSWGNPDLPDHDRALNKRGQRAAPAIGSLIKENGFLPSQAFVSDARRALETWGRLGIDADVSIRPEMYHATPDTLLDLVNGATSERIILVGHNPGIGLLAQGIVQSPPHHERFDQFPTAALLVASFDVPRWGDVTPHSGKVEAFLTPHDLNSS